MADFWKGFGQGFGPAFESSYDRARSRREKKEDRKYAEKQRQAEIDRLAQIAKDKSVAGTLAYGDAGVDLRGMPIVKKELGNWFEDQGELVFDEVTGMPRRSTRGALGALDDAGRMGVAAAAKLKHDKLLLEEKRGYDKSLLDAKRREEEFKEDFEATKAHLEALASGGKTKIPLFRLSPFREGERKRLNTFFDTAVEKYNTASVDQRDEEWKARIRVLAPYAATQTGFEMPSLPVGSRISSKEATELWDAHRLGEGEIVEARARDARTLKKEFDSEDLAKAKGEVENRLEKQVREYAGLIGNDWNNHAQGIYDELMDSIRHPDDAWKVYGKMAKSLDNQRLLDWVKDGDILGEKERNLVKGVMDEPFLRTSPEAMDFLMKNISPEKTAQWEEQYKLYNDLGKQLQKPGLSERQRKELQEQRSFLHSRSPDGPRDAYGAKLEFLTGEIREMMREMTKDRAPSVAPTPGVAPAPKSMPAPKPERPAPEAQEEGAILIDDLAFSDEERAAIKAQRDGFKMTDASGITYRKIGDYLIPIRVKAPTLPPLPGID